MSAAEPGGNHRALIARTDAEFAATAARFVTDGLSWGEHVLCVLEPDRTEVLRAELGPQAESVEFWTHDRYTEHPPRMLADYLRHVNDHSGDQCGVRVLGELDLTRCSAAQAEEWERYEAAVNAVFADLPVSFLCSYDARRHSADQLAQVRRTHTELWTPGGAVASPDYTEPERVFAALEPTTLEELGEPRIEWLVDSRTTGEIRAWIRHVCKQAGISRDRSDGAVLAVNEIAENVIRHGGGTGYLQHFETDTDLVFDVANLVGKVDVALGGYQPAGPESASGRGLWLAQQFSDRVEIAGGTVRLRFLKGS